MYVFKGDIVAIASTIKGQHVFHDGQRSRLHKVMFTRGDRQGELTLAHRHELKTLN